MDYNEFWTRVHIWVGNNFDINFHKYFELDNSLDKDIYDDDYQVCGFCKDIGEKIYLEDLFGVVQNETKLDIRSLLIEVPGISDLVLSEIIEVCNKKEISEANAMFYYANPNLSIKKNDKLYNKLAYIGLFDADL